MLTRTDDPSEPVFMVISRTYAGRRWYISSVTSRPVKSGIATEARVVELKSEWRKRRLQGNKFALQRNNLQRLAGQDSLCKVHIF